MKKKTPWEREFQEVWQQEQRFFKQYETKKESVLNRKAAEIVPEKLVETLHTAFEKAFALVFEKGTGIIQKAGRQEQRRQTFQVNAYAVGVQENRKHLRAFSKAANQAGRGNVLISGAAGIGMGLLGVALPDIPLFTAMLLKSIYETGESFGFPCEGEAERLYVLKVIETALSAGDVLHAKNRELDVYSQTGMWPCEFTVEAQIRATARKLSEAVLYGKALQNIPVVGAVGGAGDAVCLSRIQRYAGIKYRKRFLIHRRLSER